MYNKFIVKSYRKVSGSDKTVEETMDFGTIKALKAFMKDTKLIATVARHERYVKNPGCKGGLTLVVEDYPVLIV